MSSTSQFWPILNQGTPPRLTFSGPPQLEQQWHKAMEEGRHLESSINDAMFAVQKEKADLQRAIQHYMDLIQTSADSEFRHTARKFKLAADILNYTQKVHTFMNQITALTQAIQKNIQALQQIEAATAAMIQGNLNALAGFMSLICNLGLPPLPSIPAFFGANIFSFNGFNFASLSLPKLNFSAFTNFSFSQCSVVPPNAAALNTPPTVIMLDGTTIGAVSGNIVPPLGGQLGNPTQLTNPTYIAQLQGQSATPIYNPTTANPATILQGTLPNPSQIISAYELPTATYQANILSGVPAFQTNPPVTEEYKLLTEFVNLAGIVASNYDKNLTAAWLFYVQAARGGRAGSWLPNFEAAYETYIQPSLTLLQASTTTIPWNNVLGGPGVTAAPSDIPLIDTIQAATPGAAQNILWKLSYIEASLLGYPRTTQFDNAADSKYLATFTGSDLDFVSTPINLTSTATIILGADTANFPVSCIVPNAMLNVFNEVVALAAINIAADQTYVTNRPQFRFTYDAFAQATQVDRFSQFWRTFNFNFQQLLAQDPYVVGFVASYAAVLDSAIDPLGTATDFSEVQSDALTRNRSWLPGQPLLPLPAPPQVTIGALPGITGTTNGWTASNFDPSSFLSRPDVQSLPLPVQYTMLRTNESYAAVMTTGNNVQTVIDTALAQATAALQSVQNNGFDVTSSGQLVVKNSVAPLPVTFDQTSYDNTNYVTSPTLFTIQVTGTYMISGTITWDKGPAGVRTVVLLQNSTIVLDEEDTDVLSVGPITQNFSVVQQLNAGDTLQVVVTQSTGVQTNLIVGSEFAVVLVPTSDVVQQGEDTDITTPSADNSTRSIPASVSMAAGTAITILSNGSCAPVDPVGASSAPFVSGVTTDLVTLGNLANVGTGYGVLYTITGASFTVGGLIYAGPGGVLTQDYNTLITEVNWVIVVGRAIGADMLLFSPQIPTQIVLGI